MHVFAKLWATATMIGRWLTLSPTDTGNEYQQVIGIEPHHGTNARLPIFRPPGSNIDGFTCNYSAMGTDWSDCSTSSPGCWLKYKTGQYYFNITTDYEAVAPIGITRNYTLYVTDDWINADGMNFTEAKVFNGKYPGPLLEACWGDTLNITVVNKMKYNGTSIHWHGIRQNQTMHMDGVNGITQCPIPPGESFSYVWKATQYGSSWYHSHYSVQYADGLQGPITIHGPTTAHYDRAIAPLITSDWLHNSAFEAQFIGTKNATLLLGGTGNISRFYNQSAPLPIPDTYEMTFDPMPPNPKTGNARYLLRVINTSYSSQITFSIDNHYLTIVEADFVPVLPTKNLTSVMVAIGQRYHIIVEAKPYYGTANPKTDSQNFWIRTLASGCRDDVKGVSGYERTGILRYVGAPKRDPTSLPWPNIPAGCDDTLSTQFIPALQWNVTKAANGGEVFQVTFNGSVNQYALAIFSLQPENDTYFTPFQTTYGNPTFLNLDNDAGSFPQGWVVIPENYTAKDYVYIVLEGGGHPIHLHGHDFAILDYQADAKFDRSSLKTMYKNPARRDVILLPPTANATDPGYAVIAFKTDNPGAWLMHCHIAFHASGGLSLQFMERQKSANDLWPPDNSTALTAAHRLCNKWNSWAYDCRNYWPGPKGKGIYPSCQDDSRIQNDSGV